MKDITHKSILMMKDVINIIQTSYILSDEIIRSIPIRFKFIPRLVEI